MKGEKLRPRKGGQVSKEVRNRRHARGSLKELRPGKAALRPSVSFPWETNSKREVAEHYDGTRRPPAAQPQGRGRNKRMDGN